MVNKVIKTIVIVGLIVLGFTSSILWIIIPALMYLSFLFGLGVGTAFGVSLIEIFNRLDPKIHYKEYNKIQSLLDKISEVADKAIDEVVRKIENKYEETNTETEVNTDTESVTNK